MFDSKIYDGWASRANIGILGIAGVNCLFLIQHLIGIEGHPRRVFLSPEIYDGWASIANIGILGIFSSLGIICILWTNGFVVDRFKINHSPNHITI